MNNTLHTPAPWLRSKSGKTFQIVAGSDGNGDPNELVATVNPIGYNCEYEPCDETKANARLIASAPDLVDLLEAAIARVQLANEEGNPILSAWLPDALSTLRKAKGEA
jgi:hypothetical protein